MVYNINVEEYFYKFDDDNDLYVFLELYMNVLV